MNIYFQHRIKKSNSIFFSQFWNFLFLKSQNCEIKSHNCLTQVTITRISRCKLKGDRAFVIAGSKLWNSLPVSIRTIATESLFKTRLEAYLFESAFNIWANRSLLFQITILMYFDSF